MVITPRLKNRVEAWGAQVSCRGKVEEPVRLALPKGRDSGGTILNRTKRQVRGWVPAGLG